MPVKFHVDEKIERHATWLELFYDLIFVLAVARLSLHLEHSITWSHVWQYAGLFAIVFWAWLGHTVHATRFDSDDYYHRVFTFIMMFGALMMAEAIPHALDNDSLVFALGYILAEIALVCLMIRAYFQVQATRMINLIYASAISFSTLLWIISLFTAPPLRFHLWLIGMIVNFAMPWVVRPILQRAPLDPTHYPERLALFVIIMLGEVVALVLSSLDIVHWNLPATLAAVLCFVLVINLWWQYFCYNEAVDHRRSLGSGQPFLYSHYVLLLSLGGIGAAMRMAISSIRGEQLLVTTVYLLNYSLILWIAIFIGLLFLSCCTIFAKHYTRYCAVAVVALVLVTFDHHWHVIGLLLVDNIIFAWLAFGHKMACRQSSKITGS